MFAPFAYKESESKIIVLYFFHLLWVKVLDFQPEDTFKSSGEIHYNKVGGRQTYSDHTNNFYLCKLINPFPSLFLRNLARVIYMGIVYKRQTII